MNDTALADPQGAKPLSRRILEFPLTLLVVGSLWIVLAAGAIGQLYRLTDFPTNTPQRSAGALLIALVVIAAYKAFKRWVERAPDLELSYPGLVQELALGLAIGAALFSVMTAVVAALGGFEVLGIRGLGQFWSMIGVAVFSGTFEEVLFRGIVMRQLETLAGSWAALAITSLVFGLAHLGNPDSSLFAALAISLEAGVLLGGAFLLTRRLWLAIGIHMAWNFTQGWVFSVPVSGGEAPLGWLITRRIGPDWLTGGEFGLEASVVAMIVATVGGILMLVVAQRRGHIRKPGWTKGKLSDPALDTQTNE